MYIHHAHPDTFLDLHRIRQSELEHVAEQHRLATALSAMQGPRLRLSRACHSVVARLRRIIDGAEAPGRFEQPGVTPCG